MTISDPNYDNSNAKKHLARYLEDPESAHVIYPFGDDRPVTTLLLTTTGNKSGELRTTPLIYKQVGGDYVIVGSLAGSDNHPSWFRNLQANQNCTVQAGTTRTAARARIPSGAERQRFWNEAAAQFPTYDIYQAKTDREIPVVVLTPIADPA